MRTIQPSLIAAAALMFATASAFAAPGGKGAEKKGVDCSTVATIRLVTPFQLTETSREEVNDCTSQSTYTGTGLVEYATCGVDYPDGPPQVEARVDLKTTTVLDECGSGFTNGTFTLTLLDDEGETTDSIQGTLSAVNRNFGELQGLLEGMRRYHNRGKDGNYTVGLRATFTAAFIAPDNDGVFDAVEISEAHGVTYIPNRDASGGKSKS